MTLMVHFPLQFSRVLGGALALSLAATPAFARENLNPPPSGIVVHLFGPNSVTSNIMPAAPGAATPGGTASSGGSGPAGTAGTNPYNPSWSDIAHQMFVTGDPSQEGAAALPKGKTGGN